MKTQVMAQNISPAEIIVIDSRPDTLWQGLRELLRYREMVFFLAWRNIRVRYQQTVLGMLWAVIQPFMTMIVFSLFFGGLAQIPSDGVPYPVFSFTALVPWALFSTSITQSAQSLVGNANMIRKVYFPRLVIPLSTTLSVVVDFVLAFIVLLGMIVFFMLTQPIALLLSESLSALAPLDLPVLVDPVIQITENVVFLPLFFLLALTTSLGVGLWFSALNVQFRDIRYTIPFITQLWLFITPIVYPSSLLDEPLRTLYGINPMAGVVEGFRWALLGVDTAPGPIILLSSLVALMLLVSGLWYFKRVEDSFADLV